MGAGQLPAQRQCPRVGRVQRHRPVSRRNRPRLIAGRQPEAAKLDPVFRIIGRDRQRVGQRFLRPRHVPLRHGGPRDHTRSHVQVAVGHIGGARFLQRSGGIALQQQRLRHDGAGLRRRRTQCARAGRFDLRPCPVAQFHQRARLRFPRDHGSRRTLDRIHQFDPRRARVTPVERRQSARQRGAAVPFMHAPLPQARHAQQQDDDPGDQEDARPAHACI